MFMMLRREARFREKSSGENTGRRGWVAIKLNDKQVVSFEKLLMSQVVAQEALTGLLDETGVFTKKEFLEMVRVVNKGMKEEEKEKLNEWGKR
jgi:hypothetical protein